ncbi:acetyltransferase [Ramlibacter algicola]|uniref:Acetyltransferase n=1 Tax=Ramlibacter algicola TaxID=2795217 RepID=A0A934PZK4_9BURK|nr:acetyltransferase [Ramlibacter algicola]MBK0391937.1 acetyltransferase [Ramlibacter algicola]
MTPLILAGNAVTAEVLLTYLRRDSRYSVIATTVDDAYAAGGSVRDVPCVPLSQLQAAHAPGSCRILMAMGYDDLNRTRASMFERLRGQGYTLETYVHPDARVFGEVGEGSIVLPGAIVEPLATVGRDTMVWSNVTLAHHSTVGDHCWVAAGTVVSGQAVVEHHTFVGVGATIVNKIKVADHNIIGAGALITRDTKPDTVHLARSAEPVRFSANDYVKHFGN